MIPGSPTARIRRPIGAVTIGLAITAATVLAGCVPTAGPEPTPRPSASSTSGSSPSPAPEPTLVPEGNAADNLAYFDAVNSTFLAANPTPGGRQIIDNLVAAGFDKSTMQVTPDVTAIGGAVDSVQFAVRFGDRCLIGQSSGAGYVGIEGPVVGGSTCLLGTTRAIDW